MATTFRDRLRAAGAPEDWLTEVPDDEAMTPGDIRYYTRVARDAERIQGLEVASTERRAALREILGELEVSMGDLSRWITAHPPTSRTGPASEVTA
jgi:hypothetical protein